MFEKELKSTKMLILNPVFASYYSDPQTKFSESVVTNFPTAAPDIEEAGRCFALGRHTACVFHLMRIVETALSPIAKIILPNDPRPNWDPIIKKLDAELKLSPKDRSISGDPQFLAELSAHANSLKLAWRNRVMHIDAIMTEERAKVIFDATAAFMNYAADHISSVSPASERFD